MEQLKVEAFCLALPFHCRTAAAQTTVDPLRHLDRPPLPPVPLPPRQGPTPSPTPQVLDQSAASAPPEDSLASDCRYVGFQTEWVAFKRDVGLPLVETLAAVRRVFARDMPWPYAIARAMGTLVSRSPQRSPTELRQAMEAVCLAQPLLWVDRYADW